VPARPRQTPGASHDEQKYYSDPDFLFRLK